MRRENCGSRANMQVFKKINFPSGNYHTDSSEI